MVSIIVHDKNAIWVLGFVLMDCIVPIFYFYRVLRCYLHQDVLPSVSCFFSGFTLKLTDECARNFSQKLFSTQGSGGDLDQLKL